MSSFTASVSPASTMKGRGENVLSMSLGTGGVGGAGRTSDLREREPDTGTSRKTKICEKQIWLHNIEFLCRSASFDVRLLLVYRSPPKSEVRR